MEVAKKIPKSNLSPTSAHVKVLGASKALPIKEVPGPGAENLEINDLGILEVKDFDTKNFETTDLKTTESTNSSKATHTDPPLEVGTVLLGRYMLMRLIAQGGTSFIYRARDMIAVLGEDQEQSHIAIKIVKQLDSDLAGSQLMLYEALTTRHLAHPNIIKVYDYHRDGDLNFVTMELISGESLAELLTRSPDKKLCYRHGMVILHSVAQALQAAHDQGVIHSDIKPSNILMTDRGDVKVIDFATARASLGCKDLPQALNHDASFYGYTLAYASPETIVDKPAKPSDDVFSFACIVYETLEGKHPYGRNASNSAEAAVFKLEKPESINLWQWRVLKRALSLKAEKRYSSVQGFMQAFDRSRRSWTYGVIAALLVIGIVASYQGVKDRFPGLDFTTSEAQSSLVSSQELAQKISRIRNLAVLDRAHALSAFDGSQGLNRFAALGELRADVVDPIVSNVQSALNYDLGDLPDFKNLFSLLDAGLKYYPDSAALVEAKNLVATEREQLTSSLIVQYRQIWAEADFSIVQAENLNGLAEKLLKLDEKAVIAPEEQIASAYAESVDASLVVMDFKTIDTLFLFASTLSDSIDSAFIRQWRDINSSIPIAANNLVKYTSSELPRSQQYPPQALKHIVTPHFDSLQKEIADVWLDKDIVATKEKLFIAAETFILPADSPIFKQAKTKLIGKINAKIKYHEAANNPRSLRRLRQLLRDIA